MNKLLLAIILLLSVQLSANFQTSCLPEGIEFHSQSQIDYFQTNYPNCTEIEGDVTIHSGGMINNLNGLNVLTSIGGTFHIHHNANLPGLSGLENLILIGGDLIINSNHSLINLTGLENLSTVRGDIDLYNNDTLVNLAGINSLEEIGGNLTIGSNHSLIKLMGLEGLTSTAGDLEIDDNESLINLFGLQSLTSIGGSLQINENASLIDLDGLQELMNISGALCIGTINPRTGGLSGNPSLESLYGLNNLDSIGESLYILDNHSLISPIGLENLSYIEEDLVIADNALLSSLEGFENLSSINGSVVIGYWVWEYGFYGNPSLSDLTALENLTSIGVSLSLRYNDILTTLEGLDNIEANSIQSLEISGNPLLSSCAVQSICDYLATPGAEVFIEHNASGCNSPEEVDLACLYVSVGEMPEIASLSVYPNPSSGIFNLQFTLNNLQRVTLKIYDLHGRETATILDAWMSAGEHEVSFDVGEQPSGMYFIRLQDEDGIQLQKIVNQ